MDETFSTPESPSASTETVASPAPAQSASAEALTGSPTTQTESQVPVGESQSPVQEIEFPEDNVFQSLSPDQRRSNWQQLRDQYAETKRRVTELSQLEAHKPTIETIESLGGLERLQSQAELVNSLFSPVTDPETGEPIYDSSGLPQYTAEPFLDRLVNESPSTFRELMWRGFDQSISDSETIGHWFLRERLGLNPDLLSTYQQIQSPQDGARFNTSSISPDELIGIPEQYHEAAKSLTPEMREELSLMGEAARDQLLATQQRNLDNQKFIDEQKAYQAEQRQREVQAYNQRVQQAGEQKVQSVHDASLNAQRERLQKEAQIHPDKDVNGRLHNVILRDAVEEVLSDPLLSKDAATWERLCHLATKYEFEGDRFKAMEAQNQADRLATKLNGRLTNAVTKHTSIWSSALGSARSQNSTAQPRVEIGSSNGSPSRAPNKHVLAPPNSDGFGFTPERLAQFTAELEQRGNS